MIDAFNKLIILGRDLLPLADLENAYNIIEDERMNTIGHIQFALPYNDYKNQYCEAFNYIRNPGGELYRIMSNSKTVNEEGDWEYRGEHVFATLVDTLMIGDVIMGGVGASTADVIRQILARQPVQNWILGECDFEFYFEYGWTDESLMTAVLDVPHHFLDPFQWTFDTHRYPFVLNLKRLNPGAEPDLYIEQGKNRIKAVRHTDQTSVCTRLYPYGYGEGVNRLDITSVNNGVPFIQSPPEIFNLYPSAIERTFVDRRIQRPQSLLEIGHAILKEAQVPFVEYTVELTELGGDPFSRPSLGKIADIVGFKKTYIIGIRWVHKEVPECTVTLANRTRDIANEVLQIRNRQRIEATYAQGVTQFWQVHNAENATPTRAAHLPLFIPGSMRIINFVTLNIEVRPFEIPVAGRTTAQPGTSNTGGMTSELNTGSHTVSLSFTAPTLNAGSLPTATLSAGALPTATLTAGTLPTLQYTQGTPPTLTFTPGSTPTGTLSGGSWPALSGAWPQFAITNVQTRQFLYSLSGATWEGRNNHAAPALIQVGIGTTPGFSTWPTLSAGSWPTLQFTQGTPPSATFNAGTMPTAQFTQGSAPTLNFTAGSLPSLTFTAGSLPSLTAGSATLTGGFHAHAMTNHMHSMPHTHLLEPGIQAAGNPTSFILRINGQNRQTITGLSLRMDIKVFMAGNDGEVSRDFLHQIEVIPNAPGFVRIMAFVQGFLMAERELVI